MPEGSKRIVLVYPPYASPLGAPLGVCMLKSYVDRTATGWSARVLDLVAFYHDETLATFDENTPLVIEEESSDPLTLRRAAECFRGGSDEEFYGQPERHGMYVYEMYNFFPAASRALSKRLEGAYRNAEAMPEIAEKLADRIMAESPGAVGLSICLNEQFWFGICLAKIIKQRSGIPVILGGTFFIEGDEDLILEFEDVIDFIVIGDGEQALAQLLVNPESPADVPGLWWRSNGEARVNPPAIEPKLDVLGHPDFSDIDFDSYYSPSPVIPILTSRGCYWRRCTFCTHYKSYGLTYRVHSIPYVIEEMKRHIANGISHFSIVDELMAAKRFDQLAVAIKEAKLDVRYYAMSRPTRDFTRDRLQRIYDSGCRFVMWGVESGSQRVLDLIEKGTDKGDLRDLLHVSAEVGLFNHVFVFFGFPTETREEAIETIQFLDENRDAIHQVLSGTFGPTRGSPIFDHPENFSISKMQRLGGYPNHNAYDYKCSKGMSAKQANKFMMDALPYLRAFNPFSPGLGKCREHALLVYSRLGKEIDPQSRDFPPCPVPTRRSETKERETSAPSPPEMPDEPDRAVAEHRRRRWLLRIATAAGARMGSAWHFKVRRNLRRYSDYEIKEYPKLLSDLECERLIEETRSRIQTDGSNAVAGTRWIRPIQLGEKARLDRDERILKIQKRFADLTRTTLGRQEKIQVAHYDEFVYGTSHFDNVGHGHETGDREYTVIAYLNDDFEGGSTYFPELGKRIAPEKGKAIVFRNLTTDTHERHPLARHAEELVLSGEKWVCNQWIRQRPFSNAAESRSSPRGSGGGRRMSKPHARQKKRRKRPRRK